MRAWTVPRNGPVDEVLSLVDVADPEPGPGQVVVGVEAAACNFADILYVRGEYQERPALPFTPGLELAGTVIAAGAGAPYGPGDRVFGSPTLPHGGFAERALLDGAHAHPVPAGMSGTQASGFFVAYQTGWCALHHRTTLRTGETLLVHAAAGGVGAAAVQLGVAAGARVIATVGSAEKVEVARRLGAHEVIVLGAGASAATGHESGGASAATGHESGEASGATGHNSGEASAATGDRGVADALIPAVKDLTDGRGVDVVYDPVGGDTFDASRRVTAWEGRILVIGFAGGRIADAPTNHALVKNYDVVGVHWAAYRQRAPRLVEAWQRELEGLWTRGLIDPLVGAEYALEELPAALAALAARTTTGRVVVVP